MIAAVTVREPPEISLGQSRSDVQKELGQPVSTAVFSPSIRISKDPAYSKSYRPFREGEPLVARREDFVIKDQRSDGQLGLGGGAYASVMTLGLLEPVLAPQVVAERIKMLKVRTLYEIWYSPSDTVAGYRSTQLEDGEASSRPASR